MRIKISELKRRGVECHIDEDDGEGILVLQGTAALHSVVVRRLEALRDAVADHMTFTPEEANDMCCDFRSQLVDTSVMNAVQSAASGDWFPPVKKDTTKNPFRTQKPD